MKKMILLFTAIAMVGCSDDDNGSDDNGGTSFRFDGTEYQLQPAMGMSMIVMPDAMEFNDESYDRATLTIVGLNGTSSTASVSFDLYHKPGTSVAGTYDIYDSENDEEDVEDFFAGEERGCMGWTSMGSVFSIANSTMTNGNNPTGTVTVTVNSESNYTLTYNGNFRLYENGFDFVRNMPAEINVTSDVTIQDVDF